MLNSEHLSSAKQKQDNYEAWVKRYQGAPAITESQGCAGAGFITSDKAKQEQALQSREAERNRADNPQDRERLGLLLNAERAYCGVDPKGEKEHISNFAKREHMSKLMEYDHKHGHPVTDMKRDLAQGYHGQEQHNWLNRDGRKLSGNDFDAAQKAGAYDVGNHRSNEYKAQSNTKEDWFIAPQVKEKQQQSQLNVQSQTLKQEGPRYTLTLE